jgi:hypothetical protein
MPTTPYAKILVSVNGAGNTSGGLEVPSLATIQFSPESTVGWTSCRWEIYDYPEGWATPASWTLGADGVIYSTSFTPALITLPNIAALWGVWMPRLMVNEQASSDTDLLKGLLDQDTTAISMLSTHGLRDAGAREKQHFTTATTRVKNWLRGYQRNMRVMETAMVAAGAAAPTGTGFPRETAGAYDAAVIPETGTGDVVRNTTPLLKGTPGLNNPGNTFKYVLTAAAIAADRILNLPLLTATDTLAVLALAQTLTNKTMVAASNTITDTSAVVGDVLYHDGTRFARASAPIDPAEIGLRLSLTTAVPVTTTDVATATSVFLVPYASGRITLYNGTTWIGKTTAEVSLALGTLTSGKNYDVFAYDNAGTVTLELSAAWAGDLARTDAVTKQDGVLCKTGALTRRLIGTIRTISTTQTTDTVAQRFCWNAAPTMRVPRRLFVTDGTATWTYVNPSGVYRQVRSTAANKFEVVNGDVQYLNARASLQATIGAATGNFTAGIGIGSTTVNSATGGPSGAVADSATVMRNHVAEYGGFLAPGYNAINWLESGSGGASTYTLYGVATSAFNANSMVGEVLA